MSRRKVFVALAVLYAVAVNAVMASGASAGSTAFTCVAKSGGGAGLNEHCVPGSNATPGYETAAITVGENTQLTLGAVGNTELKTKIALAKVILTATGVECVGCMAENHQEPNGAMDVTGTGSIRYTGVKINVASCMVGKVETIEGKEVVSEFEEVNTEPLTFTTSAVGGAVKLKISPEVGTAVAVVHLTPTGGGRCALGSEFTVTGSAFATTNGATAKFATGAGELAVGGQVAELAGEVTMSSGLTGGTHRPMTLAETTP